MSLQRICCAFTSKEEIESYYLDTIPVQAIVSSENCGTKEDRGK